MGVRHQGRELALKALYQIDIRGGASNEDLALFFTTFPADERSRKFAAQLVEGVRREEKELDKRLAVYELMRMEDIPVRVTIDEAIELAKTYGDQESGRFVNGVLDQIAARLNLKEKGEDHNPAKPHQV